MQSSASPASVNNERLCAIFWGTRRSMLDGWGAARVSNWPTCTTMRARPHLSARAPPHTVLRSRFGAAFRRDRFNLPSFPRDSSSFWIWFSRKNMATANASSASSCNLGGIMTLSNPIKSSGEGFGHSILGRDNTETNSGCGVGVTQRLGSVSMALSLSLARSFSPSFLRSVCVDIL